MPECRIRVLDEEVASKIAAGEVVERPASVVKELVENAVDAGATRIVVEVEAGGKRLVRVADNGCGMTPQEAVLALQRHATSKIRSAEDLAAVRTLGFRGEALPSIASVSRLTLLTRARGELEGVRLEAEAGEIRDLRASGAPEGTTVTVRDLFFNTPARLKFLKTDRTELGQICDVLARVALAYPGIAVRLLSDGEEILHAPGSADPLTTVAALFGNETARELLPVAFSRPGIAVEGYVARPTLTRPTRSGQHFFVNGRAVRSRTLVHALDEAYRATMPAGRFPFAVLAVEIDPTLVDVNVHPAKAEVRFLRDWEVHHAVLQAVREALASAMPGATEPLAHRRRMEPEEFERGVWAPGGPREPAPLHGTAPAAGSPAAAPATLPVEKGPEPLRLGVPAPDRQHPVPAAQPALPELAAPLRALRPIAQLWNSYILAEGPTGLVIIDQHLAHERVLFDRLQSAGEEPAVQLLAVPATLQLGRREALAVEEFLPELERLGFRLEPFGRDAFVVRAAPGFIAPGSEPAVLRQMLEELLEAQKAGGEGGRGGLLQRLAASAACKAAVKKGARLAAEEMQRLLDELESTARPDTCPHGCPVAVEISYHELLKRFRRV